MVWYNIDLCIKNCLKLDCFVHCKWFDIHLLLYWFTLVFFCMIKCCNKKLKTNITLFPWISDFVFATVNGFALIRGVTESLYPGITVHVEVINAWSQICNFDERLRNPISMRRLFCHTGLLVSSILNYSCYLTLKEIKSIVLCSINMY